MPRPATHTSDSFIASAVALFADHGPRALTMAAVARAAQAPSGSIYHRFPDRPALLAAVWRGTARGFERLYGERLGSTAGVSSAIAAVSWWVDWCREHPERTAVLLAGKPAFEPGTWSAEDRDACQQEERQRDAAIAANVRSVGAECGRPLDEVAFAMFDLPLAIVRRHRLAGEPVPPQAGDLVRRLAGAILSGRQAAGPDV